MKCSHCNLEIEEGAKFCPFCGEEIPQLLSCPNESCENYGRKVLPANYKFCPQCRTTLTCPICGKNTCECKKEDATCSKCDENPCKCKSFKEWSTAEDIKNGNIILAGITLNKTTFKELTARGLSFHVFAKEFSYLQEAHVNDYLSVYIPYCRYKELDEVKKKHMSLQNIANSDDDYFINEEKLVKSMTINSTFNDLEQLDIPFFREMGWTDDDGFDYNHFVDTLEGFGYTKIENPYDNNDDEDDTEYFISNRLDSKDWVIVEITTTEYDDNDYSIYITFDVCFSNELISYHTGKVIKRDN